MMPLLIPIILILLFGFWLARRRSGIWQKVTIIVAVPIGAVAGGYCGSTICNHVMHLQGSGESHDDIIPIAASAMAGLLIGGLVLPLLCLLLTRKKIDQAR
ncbi:MAG TPA: hypothetical protein VGO57_06775 [Verrucomicrobiae bacterium]|jgi:hypothetical protein